MLNLIINLSNYQLILISSFLLFIALISTIKDSKSPKSILFLNSILIILGANLIKIYLNLHISNRSLNIAIIMLLLVNLTLKFILNFESILKIKIELIRVVIFSSVLILAIVFINFIDTRFSFQTTGDSWALYETATFLQHGQIDSIPLNLILDWGILLPYLVNLAQSESLMFIPSINVIITFLALSIIFEFIYIKNKSKIVQLNKVKTLTLIALNMLFILTFVLSQTPFLFQSLYMNRHLLIAAIYLAALVTFYLTLIKKIPIYFIYTNLLYIFLLANLRLDASLVFVFFLQLSFFTLQNNTKHNFIVSFSSTAILTYTLHIISTLNVTVGWYIDDTINNILKLIQVLMFSMIFLCFIYLLKCFRPQIVRSKLIISGSYLVPIAVAVILMINENWFPCSGDSNLLNKGVPIPDCNYTNRVALSRIIEITFDYSGYSTILGFLIIFQILKFIFSSRSYFDYLTFNILFSFFFVVYLFSVVLKYYTMLVQYFPGSYSRMLFHIFFVMILILFNYLNDYVIDMLLNLRKRQLFASMSQMNPK